MLKSAKSKNAVPSIVESMVVDFLEHPLNFSGQCELMDYVMHCKYPMYLQLPHMGYLQLPHMGYLELPHMGYLELPS